MPQGSQKLLRFYDMNEGRTAGGLPRRAQIHPAPARTLWANADLYGSAAAAVILWISVLLPVLEPLRVALGLLMGLYVPGYLVIALLIPADRVPRLERVGLSFTVNIVLIIVSGLLMALAHFPLTAPHLMEVLLALTIVLAGGNWWVRRRQHLQISGFEWVPLIDRRIALYLGGMAVLLAVTGIVVAHTLGMRSVAFSITSPQGQLSGFPYQISEGQVYPMRLHLSNPHHNAEVYTVQEFANKRPVMKQTVRVPALGHWTQQILLPSGPVSGTMHVDFRLLNGKGGLARQLWITYQITH